MLIQLPQKMFVNNTSYYKFDGLVWFMVFNATFNNISFISWWSVLLVEYNFDKTALFHDFMMKKFTRF